MYISGVMVGVYPALLSDELGAENLAVTYPLSQVQYCTVLYCTVLYCIVLYCTMFEY